MPPGEGANQGFEGGFVDAHPVILRIHMVGIKGQGDNAAPVIEVGRGKLTDGGE